MSDDDSDERLAEWAAGYAAGFAAGCDTSKPGRLYRQVLQERDAAEKAARVLCHRLKLRQARTAPKPRRRRPANDEKGVVLARPLRGPQDITTSAAPRCCASDPGGALFSDS